MIFLILHDFAWQSPGSPGCSKIVARKNNYYNCLHCVPATNKPGIPLVWKTHSAKSPFQELPSSNLPESSGVFPSFSHSELGHSPAPSIPKRSCRSSSPAILCALTRKKTSAESLQKGGSPVNPGAEKTWTDKPYLEVS